MGPLTIALALVIAFLVLIPTRRLFVAGASQRALVVYFVSVWLLALIAATVRGPTRFMLPILLIVYLAPFVTLRPGLERLRGRFGGRFDRWVRPAPDPAAAIKDGTPPDDGPPDT
jgi:hypothetical protein